MLASWNVFSCAVEVLHNNHCDTVKISVQIRELVMLVKLWPHFASHTWVSFSLKRLKLLLANKDFNQSSEGQKTTTFQSLTSAHSLRPAAPLAVPPQPVNVLHIQWPEAWCQSAASPDYFCLVLFSLSPLCSFFMVECPIPYLPQAPACLQPPHL